MNIAYKKAVELKDEPNWINVAECSYGYTYWNKVTGELLYVSWTPGEKSRFNKPKKA